MVGLLERFDAEELLLVAGELPISLELVSVEGGSSGDKLALLRRGASLYELAIKGEASF